MRQLIGLIIFLVLNSCSQDKRLEKYNQIITDCDKIKIYVLADNELKLTKEIGGKKELENLKDILKRNVKPDLQRKFIANKKYEILKRDKVVGQLLIHDTSDNPFINFVSEDFGFGFKLTYGIGMYLN